MHRVKHDGGDDILGFIEGVVAPVLTDLTPDTIDLDHIDRKVRLVAHFGDLPIYAHTSLFDKAFTGTARTQVRLCHPFLQTFFHCLSQSLAFGQSVCQLTTIIMGFWIPECGWLRRQSS